MKINLLQINKHCCSYKISPSLTYGTLKQNILLYVRLNTYIIVNTTSKNKFIIVRLLTFNFKAHTIKMINHLLNNLLT